MSQSTLCSLFRPHHTPNSQHSLITALFGMSHSGEACKIENLEFKWGQKKTTGGKNVEVQCYESFTYDGVDYSMYDCVYMHSDEETKPYIGKLIKIWETVGKSKKVKIRWFFHSSEILNWLGDEDAHANEIFLASGEGVGVANTNPLEAIAGKCNVVCISKDSRNPQPSEQELQMADYVFYRTFDVGNRTISDKMDDKVAGLAVTFLFNRKEGERIGNVPKLDADKKEESLEFKTAKTDENSIDLVERGREDIKGSLVGKISLSDAKPACGAALYSNDVATTSGGQGSLAGDKATTYGMESDRNEMKKSKLPADHVEAEDKETSSKDFCPSNNMPSKKSTVDGSVKFSESRSTNSKIAVCGNASKPPLVTTITSSEKKPKVVPTKEFSGSDKGVKSAKDTGALDDRPSKKARVDCSVRLTENRNDIGVQRLSINSDMNKGKVLAAPVTSGRGSKAEVSSHWPDNDPKQKTNEKTTKLSNWKPLKVSVRNFQGQGRKTEGNTFEITRKPANVRGNWFRELPWEEKMKSAQKQGTLVQLSNLDPAYTSKQVEDIIWHAFKENCTAKMVQRTAISSPHSGQAFVILKTRGAAERIITELDDRCLMLPNWSPLVGSSAPPHFVQKKSAFVGRLSIDINKHQTQREWKEALSTSHYSQPNNIEYEMAMEWCLLQSKSKLWWNKFYMQQGEELRKLKPNLKLK